MRKDKLNLRTLAKRMNLKSSFPKRIKIKKSGFWILCLCTLLSCGTDKENNGKNKDCKYGKPEAIFSSEVKGISQHQFKRNGYNSQESFILNDTLSVEVYQSGCNELIQEFRQYRPSNSKSNAVVSCVELLRSFVELSPDYMSFTDWANVIEQVAPDIQINVPIEVSEQHRILISSIPSGQQRIISLSLVGK